MMESVFKEGDLVVCLKGTMCREPHLLCFSPLFIEVSHEVVPITLQVHVDIFYGTTASSFKGLDPLYFTMNPFPWYGLEFMEKVRTGSIDEKECSSCEVMNYVQETIGKALGFECTPLTRRDKYLMLVGNKGIIDAETKGRRAKINIILSSWMDACMDAVGLSFSHKENKSVETEREKEKETDEAHGW